MKTALLWILLTVGLKESFSHTDCQLNLFAECHHLSKEYNKKHPQEGGIPTACHDTQLQTKCFSSPCQGPLIDAQRYIVLQFNIANKKIACPEMDYQVAGQVTKGLARKLNLISIENESMNDCFKTAYLKCNKHYGVHMKTSHNICQILKRGLECFKEEAVGCPQNLLFERFLKIMETLVPYVVKEVEQHEDGNNCIQ